MTIIRYVECDFCGQAEELSEDDMGSDERGMSEIQINVSFATVDADICQRCLERLRVSLKNLGLQEAERLK